MEYGAFVQECPEIAKAETRQLNVLDDERDLPRGRYLLFELFCTDPACDCRRVFFNVVHVETDRLVAVIAYGWEDRAFYREWYGRDVTHMIDDLKGPTLNLASPQSEIAPDVLEAVEPLLEDEEYIERIERHYRIYKRSIRGEEATDGG